jgi:hypothetical protein
MKWTFKIQRTLAINLILFSISLPVWGSVTLFSDTFGGSQMSPLWVTNLPNVTVAQGDYTYENYVGAPSYQFQTLGNVPVLRMNTSLPDLQRVGWSLQTNFPSGDFRYEVRFNTVTQSSDTSVDAFIEIWVLNVTNFYSYDIVSLFGNSYAGQPTFEAFSSATGNQTTQDGGYQNDTYYRLVLYGGPNQNIRASLCDDQGNELKGYDLGHTTATYPAGFTIGLSQAVDRPGFVAPTDVAIASVAVTTTNVMLPHAATATATFASGFVIGMNITDNGYGYTNIPQVHIIGGGGSGAQASAVVSNGIVTSITVTNAGFGYTNVPVVVIDPPFIFNPVLSITPMSFLTFSNLTVSGAYQLQKSQAWYWTNQPVNFTATNAVFTQMVAGVAGSASYRLVISPAPSQAFATPQVVNGFVVGATVTSGGSGYVTAPAVNIVGGGGTNAVAIAHISGGVVTSISMSNAGTGYTNTPTVQIAPPPAAALYPAVQPVMRLDSASLAPYQNYQIQFKSDIGGNWINWNGGLFVPTDVTNSQYLFITNSVGFFQMLYVP